MAPRCLRKPIVNRNPSLRVAVVDRVASLVLIRPFQHLPVAQRVDTVPEQKMRAAEKKNPARRELSRSLAAKAHLTQPREPQHADQNKQARHCRDVMREKVGIEIRPKGKSDKSQGNPRESEFAQVGQKERHSQEERHQKKETVEAGSASQSFEIACHGVCFSVNSGLAFIENLLRGREHSMWNRTGLECKRVGHAVLIPAESIGKRGPTSRHCLVLEEQ